LARYQYDVTGGVLCLFAARYFGVLAHVVSGPLTVDLTTTVVHSYKLPIHDVKPHY